MIDHQATLRLIYRRHSFTVNQSINQPIKISCPICTYDADATHLLSWVGVAGVNWALYALPVSH